MAEFTIAICWIVTTVAVVAELQTAGDQDLSRVLRIAAVCGLWMGVVIIIVALANVSSGITGAAQQVRTKAHTVKGFVATHYPEDLLEAKHFFDHVQSDHSTIGFRGCGITISPSLIAKTAYLCTSVGVTVASILLRRQDGLF